MHFPIFPAHSIRVIRLLFSIGMMPECDIGGRMVALAVDSVGPGAFRASRCAFGVRDEEEALRAECAVGGERTLVAVVDFAGDGRACCGWGEGGRTKV